MFMGLRISEVLALTMSDIDLPNKKIRVRRTLTKDEKGNTIMGQTTKTYAGKRVLPIPDFLMDSIMEQMRIADSQINNEEKLLFKPEHRQYTDRENANTELKRLLKRHFGIEDITTHSLRHTYGTRCIESGMAPVVVQRLMGHTDINITLNTYTTIFNRYKEEELKRIFANRNDKYEIYKIKMEENNRNDNTTIENQENKKKNQMICCSEKQ